VIGKPKPSPKTKGKPKKAKVKKLDPDYFFSLCVRERADWYCQMCGKKYEPWTSTAGYPANPGRHCSHYIGRANYSTRFDPYNADAHCYGCHSKFEGNPHIFKLWKEGQLGPELYEIVIEKSNNIMLGKEARRSKQEIAEFYKQQYEAMKSQRERGSIGWLPFKGYL